jgi:hypothetical protein
MRKVKRTATITPIHIMHSDNFHGVRHWEWEAYISLRGELVCMGYFKCKANHKTKKRAIKCAMEILKELKVGDTILFPTVNERIRPSYAGVKEI